MKSRKLLLLVSLLAAIAIVAAQCGQPATVVVTKEVEVEKVVKETVEVEKVVTKEVEVEKEVLVTATPGEEAAAGEKTLIIGTPALPAGIDPEQVLSQPSWIAQVAVHEPLVFFERIPDPRDPSIQTLDFSKIVGRVIESWEVSEDGLTTTMHIRPGIKSPYGNEETAEDIKWAWSRAWDMQGVKMFYYNFMKWPSDEAFQVKDKYTLDLTAEAPSALTVMVLHHAHNMIFDSTEAKNHATDDDPWAKEWLLTHDCAYGPYTIKEWVPGDQLVFVPNPNYYGGPNGDEMPKIDRVILKEIPNSATRLALLTQGAIDMADAMSIRELHQLKGTPGTKVALSSGNLLTRVLMNNTMEPFDNPDVRRAVAYAAPYEEILSSVYLGMATPMRSHFPSVYPYYTEEFWPYTTDLDKAKELLAKAGYPDGFDTTLTYASEYPEEEGIALLMQTYLSQIGINVTLNKQPAATLRERYAAREFPFFIWSDMPLTPDGAYATWLYWGEGSPVNYSEYFNQEVEDKTFKAMAMTDLNDPERIELIRDIQRIIAEDAPDVFVAFPGYNIAMRDNITGYGYHNFNVINFAWLDKE